ncbi:MAG: thioredoxin-dependent thiol peroxidase [bacterium]|nr:thioredoxin-dependent thiol peroxidase [bacterium]
MKSFKQTDMIGNLAPDFTLPDEGGKMRSLSDYRGQNVILYFYPKDMTSGCTLEAQEFRDHEYEIGDLNAVVLGVSADDAQSHQEFCREQGLNFNLLSDVDGEVCRMYDVWQEKSVFGAKHVGIERTTFLIDTDGKVRTIYDNVKPLGHAGKVIEDLRKISV